MQLNDPASFQTTYQVRDSKNLLSKNKLSEHHGKKGSHGRDEWAMLQKQELLSNREFYLAWYENIYFICLNYCYIENPFYLLMHADMPKYF